MRFLRRKNTKTRKDRVVTPRPLRRQIITGVFLTVCIGLILFTVYKVSRLESMQITGVEVIGGATIPHVTIEKIVQDTLVGSYFRLVPYTFTPTYPEDLITSNIIALDRVHHAEVTVNNEKKIVVVFDEYIPFALWCKEETSRDCLFIDTTGYAFASAPELSGGAFVRFIDASSVPQKGREGFTRAFIDENKVLIEDMESELGLFVTHVIKSGDYDLEYVVSGGGRIKMSQTIALEQSFRNLTVVLESDDFSHLEPGNFKYIDLRFGDKVFVNEELGEPTASSTVESE